MRTMYHLKFVAIVAAFAVLVPSFSFAQEAPAAGEGEEAVAEEEVEEEGEEAPELEIVGEVEEESAEPTEEKKGDCSCAGAVVSGGLIGGGAMGVTITILGFSGFGIPLALAIVGIGSSAVTGAGTGAAVGCGCD